MDLSDRVALVTGGKRIGAVVAIEMAKRGADIALCYNRSREEADRTAESVKALGRRVFVTTPNRWFPVEVHTRLPLVHWLPDPLAHRAYDLARMPWAKENHLLGPSGLRALFPGPVRIDNLWLTLVAST